MQVANLPNGPEQWFYEGARVEILWAGDQARASTGGLTLVSEELEKFKWIFKIRALELF